MSNPEERFVFDKMIVDYTSGEEFPVIFCWNNMLNSKDNFEIHDLTNEHIVDD